jgi:putative oxidoreductase
MIDTLREPKLILPFLKRFYEFVIPFSWPIVRIACGMHLAIHGWGKVLRGGSISGWTVSFAFLLTFIEFVGGCCITVGMFTRFFAAAAAIEMGYLTFVFYWSNGYGWRNEGFEYVMMWGTLALAIALRGGGPYSIDRLLDREL